MIEATAAIVAYNHPSGDSEPTDEDKQNTKELAKACEDVKIKLIDHIIITGKSHFSFYDNGLMWYVKQMREMAREVQIWSS